MRLVTTVGALALLAAGCSGSGFSLEVGDCFNDEAGASEEIRSVPVVDCEEPHDNEVFAVFELPDGEYPGDDAAGQAAMAGCLERFEEYVGSDYETSTLEVFPLYPTIDGWEAGDHEVACALYNEDLSPLTGSVADTGV